MRLRYLAGPTVPDHPFRDFMPGTDRSDGALVLLLFGSTKLPALARGLGRSKDEYQAGQFDPVRPDPNPPPES